MNGKFISILGIENLGAPITGNHLSVRGTVIPVSGLESVADDTLPQQATSFALTDSQPTAEYGLSAVSPLHFHC